MNLAALQNMHDYDDWIVIDVGDHLENSEVVEISDEGVLTIDSYGTYNLIHYGNILTIYNQPHYVIKPL